MNQSMLFFDDVKKDGKRLFFRAVQETDAAELLPIYSDPDIYRYRPGMVRSSGLLIQKLIARMQKERAEQKAVYFALCEKETGRIAGTLEVFHIDARVQQAEIGYTIAPKMQGRGYATEAIALLTDYLILEAGFNRVKASVHTENKASQKALLNNSFVYEGLERQGEFWNGIGFVDVCKYAKIKRDYKEVIIMEKIREIMREMIDAEDLLDCNDFLEEGLLDSMDIMDVVEKLEEEYDIEISGQDIVPENFRNLQAIQSLIEKYAGE